MKILKTYEEYLIVISRIYKKISFDTNNLLSRNDMKEKINNGLVSVMEEDWGSWIFIDVGKYYLAYLYLINGENISGFTDMDKPVIAELVGTPTRYCQKLEDTLTAVGFRLYAKNLELLSGPQEEKKVRKATAIEKKFLIRHGFTFHDISDRNERYFPQIWKLWEDTIDAFAIHKLTAEEYERLTKNSRGIFITDDSGEVAGAGYYEKDGAVSLAHHIAASRKYNGIGVGGAVMNMCASKAFQEGTEKYISWIAEENRESGSIHRRIGKFTGKYAKQFIFR